MNVLLLAGLGGFLLAKTSYAAGYQQACRHAARTVFA